VLNDSLPSKFVVSPFLVTHASIQDYQAVVLRVYHGSYVKGLNGGQDDIAH